VVVTLLEYVYDNVESAVWNDVLPIVGRIVVLLGNLVALLVKIVSQVLQDVVPTVLADVADLVDYVIQLNAAEIIQVLNISS
jgi:hypothetical protein